MVMPKVSASTELWLRVALYLIARLTRNRRTRGLVPLIKPVLQALEAAAAVADRFERALIEARAYHDGADDDLDDVVTAFEGELFLFVRMVNRFFRDVGAARRAAAADDEAGEEVKPEMEKLTRRRGERGEVLNESLPLRASA